MNLLQVRQWFIRESGRYDLVVDTTSWVDNGANAYINAGQRMLDRMLDHKKMLARNFQNITADQNVINFTACRAVKEVWIFGTGVARKKLERKTINWIREQYPDMETSVITGQPQYWAPAILRVAPEAEGLTMDDLDIIANYADVMYESHYAYNGVLFAPVSDGTYTLETWGLFYSTELTTDTQESFWSVNHPELLVMAAQCVVEKFNRNAEGVRDWKLSIVEEIQTLAFDLAEEDFDAEGTVMEG